MVRKKIAISTPSYFVKVVGSIIYLSYVPFSLSFLVIAEERFNTSFIYGANNIALARDIDINSENYIIPGKYPFDIYLNGQRVDHRDVEFKKSSKDTKVLPCIIAKSYQDYGINIPDHVSMLQCYDLSKEILGTKLSYDLAIQRIDIDVPQIFLVPHPQGAISSKIYDNGINAGFINYNFTSNYNRFRNWKQGENADYYFLSLNSGLNLGQWRIRNHSSIRNQSNKRSRWNNISSWAETTIVPLHSNLIIGQSSTNNQMFDSIQFRGVQLSSANEMIAESQRGYMPTVHGVAQSNARVEIRQNGYVIYTTNVPAGPFTLTDIFPSSLSGNLTVTVIEDNGVISNFIVPFSSLPNMLREGVWQYQLTAGTYYGKNSYYQPKFMQATLSHGLTSNITSYGGVLRADNYRSAMAGIGKNLGNLGGVSMDVSYSDTHFVHSKDKKGTSFRVLYAKSLHKFGTELQIASYHYLTSGYYYFSDSVAERNRHEDSTTPNAHANEDKRKAGFSNQDKIHHGSYLNNQFSNKRQRLELSINQRMTDSSTLYASVSNQSYWDNSNKDASVKIGLNSSYKNLNYGVFYQDSRNRNLYKNRSINFTVSVPLNIISKDLSHINASFNSGYSKQNGQTYSTSFTGSTLYDNRLNYSLQIGHDRYSSSITSANVGYYSNIGIINAGYSYGYNYKHTSLRLAGGIVAHSGGITFTQPLQNSFVLIEAKNAKGVQLDNQTGIAIDRFGYAVMTSVSPYHHNRVALKTEYIKNGLDIPIAVKDVVPTNGAITRVKFETHIGHNLLVHSKMIDGQVPPIGASVFNADGRNNGVVGMNGNIYVSGVMEGENLLVKWSDNIVDSCSLSVPHLQPITKKLIGYQELSLICQKNKKE